MGCTQSKIENEEAVSRCKERKQFMKEAVSARNAFAAAHSAYATYLKNTGAALSDYAQGEVENPLLSHHPQSNIPPATIAAAQSSYESFPPPPPPPGSLPTLAPLQRAATMPEMIVAPSDPKPKPNPIIEEGEEDENEIEDEESLVRRRRSGGSSRGGHRKEAVVDHHHLVVDDDGPPPMPPSPRRTQPPSPPRQGDTPYDFIFSMENVPRPTLSDDVEEVNINKDEIHRKDFDDGPPTKRAVGGVDYEDDGRRSAKAEAVPMMSEKAVMEPPPPPEAVAAAVAGKSMKKVKQVGTGSSVDGKRMVKSNVNLLQIFVELDDHFLKASESAHEVSKMLEATRLHYHSNFADNRGHIDHSARVMRVITWNRSFRGLNTNNDDGKDDFDSEEHETHATVLDKLLAWEKKLYDEVKAGELMKFEYQRKVASLKKLQNRDPNSGALEKAKAAVSHLHTRYIVDMQSMDSTVSEISRLRDEQLYPKLVQLVDGMATMWETMQFHHESQSKIVQALRSIDISQSPKETSEHHHERTIQLLSVVQGWHQQYEKLVSKQKEYIKSLNSWLKLNLIPVENSLKERVSSPARSQSPPIKMLLQVWQDHLEKLPDELARTAIHNFAAVIDAIMHHQLEEMRLKDKCEDTKKELDRKDRQFRDWHNKYLQRRIPDELDPDRAEDNISKDIVAEKQFLVDMVKKRLEEDEEAYKKHCRQVREKSLTSLKTHLPELFRALSDFASSCSEMYRDMRSRLHHQNRSEGSA
ncbi:protein ROLLING AND ERECT LEAF 2 [Ziziphus jujuba]|uniref:Protein ROLLING AND ERECT LEAF 2 n=1 Tax=Ziziphus jujuba TaxID=326968 RepID=A0A6P3YV07_ZIZJJ|nr:protein ROLLING AND ERECT LEAF 2 [Ziziphus jujuba]